LQEHPADISSAGPVPNVIQKTSLSTGRPGSFSKQPGNLPVRSAGNVRLYRQPVSISNLHVPGRLSVSGGQFPKIPAPDPPTPPQNYRTRGVPSRNCCYPPSPRVMHKRGGVGVGLEAEGYTPDLELGKLGNRHPFQISGVNHATTILKSGVNYTILWIKTT